MVGVYTVSYRVYHKPEEQPLSDGSKWVLVVMREVLTDGSVRYTVFWARVRGYISTYPISKDTNVVEIGDIVGGTGAGYKCPECGTVFNNIAAFERHLKQEGYVRFVPRF